MFRQKGLRVKQHAFHQPVRRSETKYSPILADSTHRPGQILNNQRMIPGRDKRIRHATKQPRAIMLHRQRLAMHRAAARHHTPTSSMHRHHLHTQANPKHRDIAKPLHHIAADPRAIRPKRTRRQHNTIRPHRLNIGHGNCIRAVHHAGGAGRLQPIHQIPGKRIVVV